MAKSKASAAAASKKSSKSSEKRKQAKKAPQKALKKVALWSAKPKTWGIGQSVQAKRDLTRFVRWPRYVKVQRQRRVLYNRLKTPPAINQFTNTADYNTAKNLFRLLGKYRPEDKKAKRARLTAAAAAGGDAKAQKQGAKPLMVKCGVNHVTALVENRKAKLVVIAHDVDPIELVIWLPALCRKMDVPYMVVKSKSRLGAVVHKKTASCLALTEVRKQDVGELNTLVQAARDNWNNNTDMLRTWGGGKVGIKSGHVLSRRIAAREKEQRRQERVGA